MLRKLKLLPILLFCLALKGNAQQAPAPAPSLPLPVSGGVSLDLSNIVANLRPCYVFDQHKDSLSGAYVPGFSFYSGGVDMVDLDGGFIWSTVNGVGGPMGSIGLRIDNLVGRVYTNPWLQKNSTHASFPSIEAGPYGGYINKLGWLYGGFVALKI